MMVKAIDADRICYVCKHMASDGLDWAIRTLKPGTMGELRTEVYVPDGDRPRRVYYTYEGYDYRFRASLSEYIEDNGRRSVEMEMEMLIGKLVFDVVEPPSVENGRIVFKLPRGMVLCQTLEA